MTTATMATGTRTTETAGRESELRAVARRRGLTMKELAAKMGVSAGYLSGLSTGRTPWTPKMREKVAAVLGEVPGQGIVYRQVGVVNGESSFIRERAREMGMTMRDLADEAGVSYSYLTQAARGPRSSKRGSSPSMPRQTLDGYGKPSTTRWNGCGTAPRLPRHTTQRRRQRPFGNIPS